jgi:hypothetical protein
MSRRWTYLLAGLMCPAEGSYLLNGELVPAETPEEVNLADIDVRVRRVFLTDKQRIGKDEVGDASMGRFLFYLGQGVKDDDFAERFAGAVTGSLALLLDNDASPLTAIGVPETIITKRKHWLIRIKDVTGGHGIGSPQYFDIMSCVGFPSRAISQLWQLVPAILGDKAIMEAAHFYRESISLVWIADDDVFEIMCDDSDVPTSLSERVRLQTAYLNAYKAVEAVIGEPPRDKRKLRARLAQIGVDPDEKVGYELYGMTPGMETVLDKLLTMQKMRDKVAAHAKTDARVPISYCELKDKQGFARDFLLTAIQHSLPTKS